MEELLTAIVSGLVEKADAVKVTADPANEEGVVVYHVSVDSADMGRIIGKQGKIAKSIRTVMRAAASRSGEKIQVDID